MLKTIVTLCLALASIAAAQPTRWLILNTANQNARRIWGLPICSDAPTDAQVLTYVGAEGCWKAQNSASGFANPMTTRGDLIYRSEAGTTRLALGANGQVLISDGTDALWGTLYPGVTGDGANGLTVTGKVSAASIEVGSPGTPSTVSFTQQVADPASAETGTDYTVYFLDGKMKQVSSTGDVSSVGDTDFLPSIAADTVTIAAGKVRFANTYYGLSGGTAANPSGTGNVYFFLRPIDGSLAVAIGTGVTSAGTLTNIADAGAQDGVPEGGIPVATCAVDTDNYTTCTRTVALIGREKPMVGDSGAGGAMGMVPAPAAGDAAAGKYLKADGTWQTPAGSGDVSSSGTKTESAVTVWDASGNLVSSDCTITDGVLACGDGTNPAGLILPETTAGGGTYSFRLYGASDQSEDGCIVVSGQPGDDQILRGTETTATIDGKTCRVMVWEDLPAGGGWNKYTVTFANNAFKTADTAVSIVLGELPANGRIEGLIVDHEAFAGTGITAFTCSLGDGTNHTVYAPALNLLAAAGTSVTHQDGGSFSALKAAHNLTLRCTANVNIGDGAATVLTAGSLDIWLKVSVLQ